MTTAMIRAGVASNHDIGSIGSTVVGVAGAVVLCLYLNVLYCGMCSFRGVGGGRCSVCVVSVCVVSVCVVSVL